MNISDNGYNMNIRTNSVSVSGTGTSGTAGVTGTNAAEEQGNAALSGNAQISQVAEGQLFHGQIMNITNNEVSIALDNQKMLFAHMAEAVNLNIGDSMTFMVRENDGSNVVIRPFMNDQTAIKDNAIFKILEVNNFSPSEKNYRIAEELMKQNMPLDRAGMQRIMQQAYKYRETPIDTLVTMNRLEIPVDAENISQFQDYLSNTHQIVNNIQNLSSDIMEYSAETISNMAVTDGQAGAGGILEFQGELLAALSDSKDMSVMQQEPAENIEKAELAGGVPDGQEQTVSSESELFHMLAELGMSEDKLAELKKSSDEPMQLLNQINRLLQQNSKDITAEQAAQLFLSDGYREILKKAVDRKLTLDGDTMKNPQEIDALYKGIYEKTSKLMNVFAENGGKAGEQMHEQARSVQERLDFIQNLNQMYSYVQMPVRMSNQEFNSELFVYMNKRAMKDTKKDVSALLHLDMEHLGPTDVHVSLHGSVVHTRFYVEDETSAKLIDDHMSMLENAINECGYSLENETITREPSLALPENMVVKEMLGQDMEKSVKRYSFDVRT